MGIPKFFRYISERYPCVSQVITDQQIPAFDAMYLDMNGIVHQCTHGNDSSAVVDEKTVFSDVCIYVEDLFNIIKPKKLLFLAIDGVAPRAKMNQQRARRFRSAREAEEAKLNDEKLLDKQLGLGPDNGAAVNQERFDSNCITPGTLFMEKLSAYITYFIQNKISNDLKWQKIKVIYSGHEVPGEGEHKIQDYIRNARVEPGYDPNTKHCLYGLDADLIVLGLVSHEPHFSLLREEVVFGRKPTENTHARRGIKDNKYKEVNQNQNQSKAELKSKKKVGDITFNLLHLSIMRDYMEIEFMRSSYDAVFSSLKNQGIPFSTDIPQLDLEQIIDDWVLIGMLVGNDFIPHLPHIHIDEDALSKLFDIYKELIIETNGSVKLNEAGILNFEYMTMFLSKAANIDRITFYEKSNGSSRNRHVGNQLDHCHTFNGREVVENNKYAYLTIESQLEHAYDELSISEASNTTITSGVDFINIENTHIVDITKNKSAATRPVKGKKKKNKAIASNNSNKLQGNRNAQKDEDIVVTSNDEFQESRYNYYITKKIAEHGVTIDFLHNISIEWLKALQWILHYYYKGVQSWSWFYPFHYAPYISDIVSILLNESLDISMIKSRVQSFTLGKPFTPFEQLMGVLPAASRKLVPKPLQTLMVSLNSPILDFYPVDFETDLNNKKNDWEAIVLVPFIDEKRLVSAINEHINEISKADLKRMKPKDAKIYSFDISVNDSSEIKQYIPKKNKAMHGIGLQAISPLRCISVKLRYPYMKDKKKNPNGLELIKGLLPSVQISGLDGFPTLYNLPYYVELNQDARVNIHGQPSRKPSYYVTLEDSVIEPTSNFQSMKKKLFLKPVWYGWPHAKEGIVVGLSNCEFEYTLNSNFSLESLAKTPELYHTIVPKFIKSFKKTDSEINDFYYDTNKISDNYYKKKGVVIGPIYTLVQVRQKTGIKRVLSQDGTTMLETPVYSKAAATCAAQTIIISTKSMSASPSTLLIQQKIPTSIHYLVNDTGFLTSNQEYGWMCTIKGVNSNPNIAKQSYTILAEQYIPTSLTYILQSYSDTYCHQFLDISKATKVPIGALNMITRQCMVNISSKKDIDVGISLVDRISFHGKRGYSVYNGERWLFTNLAVSLIKEYVKRVGSIIHYLDRIYHKRPKVVSVYDLGFSNDLSELNALSNWIYSLNINELPETPMHYEGLEGQFVPKLFEQTQFLIKNKTIAAKHTMDLVRFPRDIALLKDLNEELFEDVRYCIGDRVRCIYNVGHYPYNEVGTVISIFTESRTRYANILFDNRIIAGSSLEGLCPDGYGMALKTWMLLNHTYGLVLSANFNKPSTNGQKRK